MKYFFPKKVLLIGPHSGAEVSGLSIAFDLLVAGLAKQGISHTVIDRKAVGSFGRSGSFHLLSALHTVALLLLFLVKLPFAGRVYTTIALSRLGFIRDACMIWPSRLLRRKIILHLHGGGYGDFYAKQPSWLQAVIRSTLTQADIIIVLGKLLCEQFHFVPARERLLRVVPNGLPIGLQPDHSAPKSLPSRQPLRLLYLSNMIESKGYLDVLAACRILKHEFNMLFRCDFCGGFVRTVVNGNNWSAEEAKAHFFALVQEWELQDIVSYHGVVKGELKQQLLHESHIFLLPTAYPWEGQPVSIIEALAFGTPVITTHFRGIPEMVIHGYNGFFVEPNAAHQIADTLQSLVHDSNMYQQLSKNAMTHFLENFTQEVHLQRLIMTICEDEKARCF